MGGLFIRSFEKFKIHIDIKKHDVRFLKKRGVKKEKFCKNSGENKEQREEVIV